MALAMMGGPVYRLMSWISRPGVADTMIGYEVYEEHQAENILSDE